MSLIFNEKFESAGYDEIWSDGETVDAGCTLDNDLAPPAVAADLSGWGGRCLGVDVVGATGDDAFVAGHLVNVTDEPDTWLRLEFVCTANGLNIDGNTGIITALFDSADVFLYRLVLTNDGGTFKIRCTVKLNGADETDYFSGAIAEDTLYKIEVMWRTSTNTFEWRINGVTQNVAKLTAGRGVGIDEIRRLGLSNVSAGKDLTIYIDNLAIDDADWPGTPSMSRRGSWRGGNRFTRQGRYGIAQG